jgi:hypothetical protein
VARHIVLEHTQFAPMSEGSSLRHRQTRAESSADLLDSEYSQDDEHVESVYQNPVRISRFFVLFPQTSSVILEKPKPL